MPADVIYDPEFAHEGEHLANDHKQAMWSLLGIGVVAALFAVLIIYALL